MADNTIRTCPFILTRGPRKGQPCGKKPFSYNTAGCFAHHCKKEIFLQDINRIIMQDARLRGVDSAYSEFLNAPLEDTPRTSILSLPSSPNTAAPDIPPPPYPGRS